MNENENGTSEIVKKNDTPKVKLCTNIIDTFFGIICIQFNFYKYVIIFSGIFYLVASYPNGYIGRLLSISSNEILINVIISKNIYLIVLPMFLLCNVFSLFCAMISKDGHKELELLIGTVVIFIESRFNIVTIDKIIIFIFYFVLIKEGLKFITRKFYLPTRHFGYYKKVE